MESEKETANRSLLFVGRVVGWIAQAIVLFLAVPLLLIKCVPYFELPEWLTTTLTSAGCFGYLFALLRWQLTVVDRLNGPTARARYRRRRR